MKKTKKVKKELELPMGDITDILNLADEGGSLGSALEDYFIKMNFDDPYDVAKQALRLWNAMFGWMGDHELIEFPSAKANLVNASIEAGHVAAINTIAKILQCDPRKLYWSVFKFNNKDQEKLKKQEKKRVSELKAKKELRKQKRESESNPTA